LFEKEKMSNGDNMLSFDKLVKIKKQTNFEVAGLRYIFLSGILIITQFPHKFQHYREGFYPLRALVLSSPAHVVSFPLSNSLTPPSHNTPGRANTAIRQI
jgi:hypothetical protein